MSPKKAVEKGIYFCGSIRAGRQDVDLYSTLIEKLNVFWKGIDTLCGR